MNLEMFQPEGDLQAVCGSLIYYKGYMPEHKIERVVPDGCVYLIFELDGIARHVYDNETLTPILDFAGCWVSFSQAEYISISAHENSEMFVIQFTPGGASRMIAGDLSQYANKVHAADIVLGELGAELRLALMAEESPNEKFEAAIGWLDRHMRDKDAIDDLIADLVVAIQENSTSRLKDLIANSDYSHKQLIHHFKQRVGLTPKIYQRIVRFNEILPMIMENQSVSWKKISIECDYYDQSHFIKEFKRFSGYSPSEFLSSHRDHEAANFFPLDDVSG